MPTWPRSSRRSLAARETAPGLAVVVTVTFTRDDRTLLGSSPAQAAERLVALGVDALGVNCGQGPAQALRAVRDMRPVASGVPMVARPNAGGPQQVGGRFLYPATPAYFGEHARALLDEGVRLIGGCCGTGPAHVRAMAQAMRAPGSAAAAVVAQPAQEAAGATVEEARTELEARLGSGRFVVAVEVEPPRGHGVERMLAAAEALAEAGADVIDVSDSPLARLRMSPWAACRLIQERVKVETVLHFPTRGRNLLRLQGDLLAVHALGIRNLFVCLGDPVAIGDFPGGTDHVDVAPTGLIRLVTRSFNQGRDEHGSSIGEPTSFLVGCAVNAGAEDLGRESALLRRKIEAGAAFALSQAVYEPGAIVALRRAYEERFGELSLPIVAGVLPLAGERHATFLHNEVPGIRVPQEIRDRLARAGGNAEGEGRRMATELALGLRAVASGIYVMPSSAGSTPPRRSWSRSRPRAERPGPPPVPSTHASPPLADASPARSGQDARYAPGRPDGLPGSVL